MWHVEEDEGEAVLTVTIDGPLGDYDLTKTKLSLKQRMARLRALYGHARILFDLSGIKEPAGSIIEHFQHVDGEFVQAPQDRVALLLRDSLDKANARKLLHFPEQASVFTSANAANLWLRSR